MAVPPAEWLSRLRESACDCSDGSPCSPYFGSLTVSFLVNPGYFEPNDPLRSSVFFFTAGIFLSLARFRCVLEASLRFQGFKISNDYLGTIFI
jgi:hypothetical protein